MKNLLRSLACLVAGFLLFLGSTDAASSLKRLPGDQVAETEPLAGPGAMPGIYSNFNPRNIPELRDLRSLPEFEPDPPVVLDPLPPEYGGSHRVPFIPASEARPPETGTSLPITDRIPPGFTDLNEREDEMAFSSTLYTDTSLYANWIAGSKERSSRSQGTFYEQNLRYDLYTTRHNGDSLALITDTTHTNDSREYQDGFTLNQLSLESRTPKSLLVFGHAYPEFSNFTMTQQVMGLYGVQRFSNTEVRSFGGYKAVEKDDLKDPRQVGGIRVEHRHDESVTVGLNAVTTKDVHDYPGSDQDLPTLNNRVYSVDFRLNPTENIFMAAEYAGSDTDFDQRTAIGDQHATAFRANGGYGRENFRFEGGVEEGGTPFLSALGESPRDERAYFAKFFYEINRYISTRIGERTARDNLQNYLRATLVRDQPEVQVTLKPSDYYKDLRIDFFYQPLHEYSDNAKYVDRYRDLAWAELNHKVGAFQYFVGMSSMIDKDKIAPVNDRDINKFDLKLTWEYDNANRVYGFYSIEHLSYKTAGGSDKTSLFGLGGHSLFHQDVSLHLDFTHETTDPTSALWDSKHDRVNLSLTKEYNNMARLILSFEGSNNTFTAPGRDFSDFSTRLRFLRSF